MYKITKTFKDFNDVEHTEDFYFHIDQADFMDKEIQEKGGWSEIVTKMVEERDRIELLAQFRWLLLTSYGIKSADGLLFDRSEEISHRFRHHPAYNVILMDLVDNQEEQAKFFRGIFPREISRRFDKFEEKSGKAFSEMTIDEVEAINKELLEEGKAAQQPNNKPATS